MKCQEFETRLNELLDQRASLDLAQSDSSHGDSSPWDHYSECEHCQGLFAAYAELAAAVRFSRPPQSSADLPQRVIEQLSAEKVDKVAPRPSSHSLLARLAAAAAAVTVAVAIVWQAGLTWKGGARGPADDGSPAASNKDDRAKDRFALRSLARDAGQRYLELAKATSDDFSDVLALVPPSEDLVPSMNAAPAALLGSTEDADPTRLAGNVAEGLEPLRRSLARSAAGAVAMFFPSLDDDTPEGGEL